MKSQVNNIRRIQTSKKKREKNEQTKPEVYNFFSIDYHVHSELSERECVYLYVCVQAAAELATGYYMRQKTNNNSNNSNYKNRNSRETKGPR